MPEIYESGAADLCEQAHLAADWLWFAMNGANRERDGKAVAYAFGEEVDVVAQCSRKLVEYIARLERENWELRTAADNSVSTKKESCVCQPDKG
ncbi:MAG: hypothetical protein HFE63_01450 [Clostridiales bacterium]|nr:hypothetical protein [Clostridiales bacterium]